MGDDREAPGTRRREFLIRLGTGAGVVAIAAQAAAALRSLVPNVTYDAPSTITLGPPDSFPDGLTVLPEQRLFIFRSGRTFHAISAVCTHLGCTVRAEALSIPRQRLVRGRLLRLTHRFACPCHGSRYDGDGTNTSGPAPTPLPWHRLSLSPDGTRLVAHLADEVDPGVGLMLR